MHNIFVIREIIRESNIIYYSNSNGDLIIGFYFLCEMYQIKFV